MENLEIRVFVMKFYIKIHPEIKESFHGGLEENERFLVNESLLYTKTKLC